MKPFQRIGPVAASIAMQLCLGIAYIWSVFQTGIANSIFGGDNVPASLTISLLLSTRTIGSVIGGKLAAKYSIERLIALPADRRAENLPGCSAASSLWSARSARCF